MISPVRPKKCLFVCLTSALHLSPDQIFWMILLFLLCLPVAVTMAQQEATIEGNYVNAIIRGLVSLWIVGAGLAGQGFLALTHGALPDGAALLAGFLGMFFVIPALWTALFGILGLPPSWPLLLKNALGIFQDRGPVGKLFGLAGTVYKTLVFLPFNCPPFLSGLPLMIKWVFFREPEHLYRPSPNQLNNAKVKDEYWIFVNGVATTSDIAFTNVKMLYDMFSRPIWLCHNPTDSILIDLLECIIGKVGLFEEFWEPKPRHDVVRAVESALKEAAAGNYKRVVLVAHSQGTIITASALKILGAGNSKDLMKKYLEVYAFADCANQMQDKNVKYLENISNTGDAVAWLGALFPFKSFWQDKYGRGIEIDGTFVTEPDLWGHLLNSHYLDRMENGWYRESRLQGFRNGQVPPNDVVTTASAATVRS